jgi:predicted transposase YbfD/YdcC
LRNRLSRRAAIAEQIIAAGGDYVLALKGNQGRIHEDVRLLFEHAIEKQWEERPHSEAVTTDFAHGRKEVRRCLCVLLSDLQGLWDDERQKWTGLTSLVRLESERAVGEQTSREVRYYLSSLCGDAARHLRTIRGHWGVENRRHYVLDVAFNEDACRVRKDNAPANFALLRQMALNLLRQEKTQKNGIRVKRSKAGWEDAYLFKVLDSCSQI